MTKKNKRAGHGAAGDRWKFPPWELALALVPYRIGTKSVAAGGGDLVKVELGRPVPIAIDVADAAEQKRVYEALLQLRWITPTIERAVLDALGRSKRDENQKYELGRTLVWRHMVDAAVARMRANGERPVGGLRTSAIQEVAENAGIESKTLQQRFDRLPKSTP
jgi:hypothetical protein